MMNYTAIPNKLKEINNWVCHTCDKKPLDPHTGFVGSPTNPNNWSDFDTAMSFNEANQNSAGLGFCLTGGIVVIDIDHCVLNGKIDENALKIIEYFNTYTEFSMSGTGVHLFLVGKKPLGRNRFITPEKLEIEIYENKRYIAITGNVLEPYTELTDRSENLNSWYDEVAPKAKTQDLRIKPTGTSTLTDEEIIERAKNSKNSDKFIKLYAGEWKDLGYPSQSEADLAFCNLLAFWSSGDIGQIDRIFRSCGLYRKKWDNGYYDIHTINTAITNCSSFFSSNNIRITSNGEDIVFPNLFDYGTSDLDNAARFVECYREKILYDTTDKQWRYWNGKCWDNDTSEFSRRCINSIVKQMENELAEITVVEGNKESEELYKSGVKRVTAWKTTRTRDNLLKEARSFDGMFCDFNDLDNDNILLNCQNGIVNLETGEIMEHSPAYLMTKVCDANFDQSADCSRWLQFLDEIFLGDTELIDFVQRCVGYSLSGSTHEQCLFFLYGEGSNGKSTFFNILSEIMSGYAAHANHSTVMESKSRSAIPEDLARLRTARLVVTAETKEQQVMDIETVKLITGGERITARFLHQNSFEYTPKYKIWLATNNPPIINSNDYGTWRRLVCIPFNACFKEEDKDMHLLDKLRTERDGILSWCIEGYRACLEKSITNTLYQPQAVLKLAQDYKKMNNNIEGFITSYVDITKSFEDKIKTATLYNMYRQYCSELGYDEKSAKQFHRDCRKYLGEPKKSHGTQYYFGCKPFDDVDENEKNAHKNNKIIQFGSC